MTTPNSNQWFGGWHINGWLERKRLQNAADDAAHALLDAARDDAQRALIEAACLLAESLIDALDEDIARMNHPARPPQTRDEYEWERELRDTAR